jgi:hypothetical protein
MGKYTDLDEAIERHEKETKKSTPHKGGIGGMYEKFEADIERIKKIVVREDDLNDSENGKEIAKIFKYTKRGVKQED